MKHRNVTAYSASHWEHIVINCLSSCTVLGEGFKWCDSVDITRVKMILEIRKEALIAFYGSV